MKNDIWKIFPFSFLTSHSSSPIPGSCALLLQPALVSKGSFRSFGIGHFSLAAVFLANFAIILRRHAVCQFRIVQKKPALSGQEAEEMISIERILCPAIFPLEADDALRYAISLARAYGAELIICHCAGASTLFGGGTTNGGSKDRIKKEMAEALIPLIGEKQPAKPHHEIVVVENCKDVGEAIVGLARERGADLIVLRSRRSRVAALLGSTAEQVSRTASCPVLVIRENESKTNSNRAAGFSRILVPHDFSSSSELALSYALSIAQKFRAELHLLHVLAGPDEDEPEIAWNDISVRSAYERAMQRLQLSVPEDIYKHCTVTHVVRWGKPYREVLAYTKEQDIELVCMGALGRDYGLQALFGSNVDRVLRQVSCPTLVARPIQSAKPEVSPGRITKPGFKETLSSLALR
jgi:nucleotide-binding universal stress UspA family protein